MFLWVWGQKVSSHVTLSELFYRLFWHNSSVLEVTYYAHNNASIMWKSLATSNVVCSMYCDYFIFFFKIKCPGKIPNIQGIWEICPRNQWFQVGNSSNDVFSDSYNVMSSF